MDCSAAAEGGTAFHRCSNKAQGETLVPAEHQHPHHHRRGFLFLSLKVAALACVSMASAALFKLHLWNIPEPEQHQLSISGCSNVIYVGGAGGWRAPQSMSAWKQPLVGVRDCLVFHGNTTLGHSQPLHSRGRWAEQRQGVPLGQLEPAGDLVNPTVRSQEQQDTQQLWLLTDVFHYETCDFEGAMLIGRGPRVVYRIRRGQGLQEFLYFASSADGGPTLCRGGLKMSIRVNVRFGPVCTSVPEAVRAPFSPAPVVWSSDFLRPPAPAPSHPPEPEALPPISTSKLSLCRSREEWPCVQGAMPGGMTPSSALLQELQHYRRRWEWCAAQESSKEVGQKLLQGNSTVCKYVLWGPAQGQLLGLGNHVLAMASAFVLALATDRILLIDSTSIVAKLFCEPFPGSLSWKLPGSLFSEVNGGTYPFQTALKRGHYGADIDSPAPVVLPWYIWWTLRAPHLFCANFNEWAIGASAFLSQSNMYWVPGLYLVPELRSKLDELFPSRVVFPVLRSVLFHPSDAVWERVMSALQRVKPAKRGSGGRMWEGHLSVGVQYRQLRLAAETGVNDTMSCVLKLISLQSLGVSLGGDSVQQKKQFLQAQPPRVLLVLTSMESSFKNRLNIALAPFAGDIRVVSLTKETQQRFGDSAHDIAALRDIVATALLTDVNLLSPHSTFGYLIAAFSKAKPLIMSATCERSKVEPCFLVPPKELQCTNDSLPTRERMVDRMSATFESCPDQVFVEAYPGRVGKDVSGGNHVSLIERNQH